MIPSLCKGQNVYVRNLIFGQYPIFTFLGSSAICVQEGGGGGEGVEKGVTMGGGKD